jgi:hypothetical protein
MNRPKRLEREEMPMADRYEPKLSVRPLADRKPAGQGGPEDDPLVELARIVSGRTTFDPAPGAKNKTVPAQDGGQSADLANDLETELLNDLQASFTNVRESFQPAPAPPPPPPAAKPVAPAQKAAPPPQPKAPPPISEVQARVEKAQTPERPAPPPRVERPAAERPPAPVPASERAERPQPVRAERAPPAPPKESRAERETPAAKQAARLSLFRPRNEGGEAPNLQSAPLRPTLPPAVVPGPPVRQTSSRWERPEATEERPPSEPSRFAPPRAAAAFKPEPAALPEIEPAEHDMFADPPPFTEEAAYEGEFNLDDFAPPPVYEEEFPPFPEEELASLSRRRSARAMIVIGALAAVVAIGAVGFFMLRPGSADNAVPPIITADVSPTKIAPEGTVTAETDPQGKLIYDRVDAGEAADDSTLVTPADDEIAAIPTDESADSPISRVIIPGGPGVDGPVAEADSPLGAEEAATGDDSTASQIGPRKVRTVVVRPDGTIVSSEATTAEDTGDAPAASADATATEASAASDAPAGSPVTRGTDLDAILSGSDGEPLPVDPDPLDTGAGSIDDADTAAVDAPAGTVPATEEAAAPDPVPAEEDLPLAADAEPVPAPEPPARPAPAAPAKKPTIVATTGSPNGPIDLTPGKPSAKPAAAPASSGGGGSLVQISAQRSEDAARASFKDLQAKFPQILSRYQPNIVRADLGERGIYFRVRVGPFSGADAQRLCEDLKSAGGDCIIAR